MRAEAGDPVEFESLDALLDAIRSAWSHGGMDGVCRWVEERLRPGVELRIPRDPSRPDQPDEGRVTNRSVLELDESGDETGRVFLSPIDSGHTAGDLFLSVRPIFLEPPAAILVYAQW